MKRLTLTTSAIALSFMIAACTAPEKADEATLDTAESVAEGVAEADHSVEIAEARAFLERAEDCRTEGRRVALEHPSRPQQLAASEGGELLAERCHALGV